ncbi:hypothetical protein [Caldanaerobacter sp.]|uniref:hypothetical protein n=1 Tax=Caldanaerobacter sp. TaxID=2930036 RepID=UPI003C735462
MRRISRLNPKLLNLSKILDKLLVVKRADGISQRTLDDYHYHVKAFLDSSPNISTYDDLQRAVIRYFSYPYSPSYRNIKLRYPKVFFNWCVREGYLPANLTEGIKKAKEDLNTVKHVPLEDIKNFFNSLIKRPMQV